MNPIIMASRRSHNPCRKMRARCAHFAKKDSTEPRCLHWARPPFLIHPTSPSFCGTCRPIARRITLRDRLLKFIYEIGGASLSCAPGGCQHPDSCGILTFGPQGLHYKRRSALSLSGSSRFNAPRIRFCSAFGRATRRSANFCPLTVSNSMSPIWILPSSRMTASGVIGRG
jgi:hypothetical protein